MALKHSYTCAQSTHAHTFSPFYINACALMHPLALFVGLVHYLTCSMSFSFRNAWLTCSIMPPSPLFSNPYRLDCNPNTFHNVWVSLLFFFFYTQPVLIDHVQYTIVCIYIIHSQPKSLSRHRGHISHIHLISESFKMAVRVGIKSLNSKAGLSHPFFPCCSFVMEVILQYYQHFYRF